MLSFIQPILHHREIEYSAKQNQLKEVITELNRITNLNQFVRRIEIPQPRDAPELLVNHEQQNSVKLQEVSVHQPIVSSKENATRHISLYHPVISSRRGMYLLDDRQNIASLTLTGQDLLKRVTI